MRYFSRLNPTGGIADFWTYIRQPTPHRWPLLLASFAATGSLMFWVTQEHYFVPPPPPKVNYISSYEAGRTDAEILESNLEHQKLKEKREAEEEKLAAEKREAYRKLGAATGVDVSDAEARGEAERAAAKKAEQERLRTLFDENGRSRASEARDPAPE